MNLFLWDNFQLRTVVCAANIICYQFSQSNLSPRFNRVPSFSNFFLNFQVRKFSLINVFFEHMSYWQIAFKTTFDSGGFDDSGIPAACKRVSAGLQRAFFNNQNIVSFKLAIAEAKLNHSTNAVLAQANRRVIERRKIGPILQPHMLSFSKKCGNDKKIF